MIAETAHLLHTPITDLMQMDLEEVLEWHREAARIAQRGQGNST